MDDFEEEYAEQHPYRFTPKMAALKGEFTLSDHSVPYFQANLTLEDASRYLRLVEDMPSEHQHKWTIEELFQREIDWTRVREDIVVNYLKQKNRRTFFNALTIALLPTKNDGHLDSEYSQMAYDFPSEAPYSRDDYEKVEVGGIHIAARNLATSTTQYLRWDENSVFAAAIDGQHRLAALRSFAETQPLTSRQRRTKIPVIFLVFDKRVGFDMPQNIVADGDNPLLLAVREIFIDLNKHSVEVSTARQILLDDQELEARCTRLLIANVTQIDSKDEIPLGLVDWKTSSVKFDTGAYFTSITALYLVVKDILSLRYPEDPLDEGQVMQFVKSVEDKLYVSEIIARASGPHAESYKDKASVEEYVTRNFDEENPDPVKNLPFAYSNAAIDGFQETYKPLFIGIFASFKPYFEFRELSKDLGAIDGDFAKYHSLNGKGQQLLKEEWSEAEFENKVVSVDSKLGEYKKRKWPFMVVWQKALLKATVVLNFQKAAVLKEDADSFLAKWVEFLNRAYDAGLFDTDILLDLHNSSDGQMWEGIAKNPVNQNIRYSNAASNKIADLLILLWYADRSGASSSDEFIEILGTNAANSNYPGGRKYLGSILAGMRSVSMQRYGDDKDQVIESRCKERVKSILNRCISET